MAKDTSLADMVALHLARGGKITRIDPGARALSDREIWYARRGTFVDPTEQRIEVCGGIQNGLGEWIYKD